MKDHKKRKQMYFEMNRESRTNKTLRFNPTGEFCQTKKIKYPTKNKVRSACAQLKIKFNQDLFFYKCPHCGDYHLTSTDKWGARS